MIILGPPLESREPTRLRSVMSKNLQEFAYRCVFAVSHPGGRAKSSPSHPRSQFLRLSSSLLFRMCMFVCVFTALASYPFSRFDPRDLSPTNSQLLDSVRLLVWFLLPRVPRFPMDILFYESASCHLLGPPGTLPFYMPLMSILRLAVFLSL